MRIFWTTPLLPVLLFLLVEIKFSESSIGDSEPTFQRCYRPCVKKCGTDPLHNVNTSFPPFPLIDWKCEDLCHYNCMNDITIKRIEKNQPVWKYFGHWPFVRWFGFEEPASALFSVFNGLPHCYYFITSFKDSRNRDWYMSNWVRYYSLVASNAWLASTIFHAKKHDTSILYDYISALILLCSGLLLIVRRILGEKVSFPGFLVVFLLVFGFAAYRIFIMIAKPGLISFDNHLKTCIGIAIFSTMIWFYWIFTDGGNREKNFKHFSFSFSYAKIAAIIIQLWFVGASMFEIFDFPPIWRTVDAHSLWHLLTVPLATYFYRFWELDYQETLQQRGHRNE
jgi:hypothetical protein